MEVVELGAVTEQDWAEVLAGEREPWGGVGEALSWAEKTHTLGLRSEGGALVALAGALVTTVAAADASRLDVVGIGGVFVTRRARGGGLATQLVRRLLERSAEMGPEHAMLFCRAPLMALYRKLAFQEITGAVWAAQPGGRIEVPLRSMWRPLRAGADWPAGRIEVLGLPF